MTMLFAELCNICISLGVDGVANARMPNGPVTEVTFQ